MVLTVRLNMKYLSNFFQESPAGGKLLVSFILLLVTLFVIKSINKVLFKTLKDNVIYYTTKKRFSYMFMLFYFIAISILWSSSKIDLTLYIGFISAGIAISLRELFTNIVAWLIIVAQKPFEVGDRISVNGKTGDVIDLKLFHFVMMDVSDKGHGEQSTGWVSHVPNNYIFIHQLTNANRGFSYVWHEISVNLTIDSQWQDAKEKFLEIITKHSSHLADEAEQEVHKASRRYMLYYKNLTPIVYATVKDGHMVLDLRYLCEPRQTRTTEDLIWHEIMDYCKNEPGITIC